MPKIFLSFARDDSAAATVLANRLEADNTSVFLDVSEIGTGSDLWQAMNAAIDEADVVVILLSRHTGKSRFVQAEAERALSGKKFVIPVMLDDEYKQNYIWSLVADRKGIRIDDQCSLEDAAEQISETVRSLNSPESFHDPLGTGLFSRSKMAG